MDNFWFILELIIIVFKDVKEIFLIICLYIVNILIYLSGFWMFIIGFKKYDLLEVSEECFYEIEMKYYIKELYNVVFVLLKFVGDLIK